MFIATDQLTNKNLNISVCLQASQSDKVSLILVVKPQASRFDKHNRLECPIRVVKWISNDYSLPSVLEKNIKGVYDGGKR